MEDINALLADMGDDVVFGAQTVQGLLDVEDRLVPDPASGVLVQVRATVCRIKTGALTGLVTNTSTLTVAGVSYRVRDQALEGDGALTVLTLAAA